MFAVTVFVLVVLASAAAAEDSAAAAAARFPQPRDSSFAPVAGDAFYGGAQSGAVDLGGSFGASGLNVHGSSYFPADIVNTALSVVLGLFALSLVLQIVTKIVASPLLDGLFTGRSMSSDDIVRYTNLIVGAYEKFAEKADASTAVPK